MKFKKNWPVIYRDVIGTLLLIYMVLLFSIFIPFIKDGLYSLVLFDHLGFFSFACVSFGCYYSSGILTDTIVFDDIGITLQQRKTPPKQIRWEEVTRIIRTKYIGGKALVFWGTSWEYGDEMYFYTNEKIENYILSNHPELKDMFPDKKDYRKWQNWNKKLRW